MKLKIRKDVPVKYECGAHRATNEYPEPNDVLYDIIHHVMNKHKRKKNMSMSDFEVTTDDFRELYGTDTVLLKDTLRILYELDDATDLIEIVDDKMIRVGEDALKIFYNIEG